ncbi:MAG: Asp-tRNA(Asn)/Glu-tRNA(Gln) amidotransferase subunit GatC [Thermodesulfovibrionales bacterium]
MKISDEDVSHIASLSRLKLSEEEKVKFQKQLNNILVYVDQLSDVDTEDVDPTSHVLNIENVFREDNKRDSTSADDALANSPDRSDNFYRVPKIIE